MNIYHKSQDEELYISIRSLVCFQSFCTGEFDIIQNELPPFYHCGFVKTSGEAVFHKKRKEK